MQKTRIEFLHDGDYFEFANLPKDNWKNLRIKRVIQDCGVFIEGEHLTDKESNTWSRLGESYVISCSTEVVRVIPTVVSVDPTATEPPKKKRGRPPKKKKV